MEQKRQQRPIAEVSRDLFRQVVLPILEREFPEETAQTAEESAPELIQKAMGQEGQQEEGLVDKAKDKLTGE